MDMTQGFDEDRGIDEAAEVLRQRGWLGWAPGQVPINDWLKALVGRMGSEARVVEVHTKRRGFLLIYEPLAHMRTRTKGRARRYKLEDGRKLQTIARWNDPLVDQIARALVVDPAAAQAELDRIIVGKGRTDGISDIVTEVQAYVAKHAYKVEEAPPPAR